MVAFYETVTGLTAERPAPVLAEFVSLLATLAIGHTQTVAAFGKGSAEPAANRSVIVEFRVQDVDAEYARLRPLVNTWVQEPATMPWVNIVRRTVNHHPTTTRQASAEALHLIP